MMSEVVVSLGGAVLFMKLKKLMVRAMFMNDIRREFTNHLPVESFHKFQNT